MALQHVIGGRTLPDLSVTYAPKLLDSFDDEDQIPGGPANAAGSISRTEYNANIGAYTRGQTWLIKDTDTNQFIWGGYLRDPVISTDQVDLVADGFAKIADKVDDGSFLVLSYDMSQWTAGDAEPLTYNGTDKIAVEVERRVKFTVKRKTPFKRNTAGNPTKWQNGVYRWVPGVPIKYIAFSIGKSHNDTKWSLEVVNATGPTGALTVLATISLAAGGPTDFSLVIPDASAKDLIGVRLIRTDETKKAKKRRFSIRQLRIGSLATSDVYTMQQLFTEVFTRLGVTPVVGGSAVNAAPFETYNASYGSIMDEVAMLDAWYWRIEPDPTTGAPRGVAEALGSTSWTVDKQTSPVHLDPEERFSHVRVPYIGVGGQTFTKLVAAVPAPGFTAVYDLDLSPPPHENIATLFAQMVANELSKLRHSGEAVFTSVSGGQKGTRVKPGHKLTLPNNGGVSCTVESVRHDADSSITTAQLVTGQPLLNRWLAKRQQLLNKGFGPDQATAGLLDMNDPAAPTSVTVGFVKTIEKEGRADWDMIVDVVHSGLDIDGNGTSIKRVVIKYRPTDTAGTPISKAQGGGWKQRRYKLDDDDLIDDVAEDNYRIVIDKVPHPHKWKWEVKSQVIDIQGDESAYTAAPATAKPDAFGPPLPTNVSIDVDKRRTQVSWLYPNDPEDTEKAHNSIAGAQVQLSLTAAAASRWNAGNIVKQDKRVKGESKRFRLLKVKQQAVYARVRYFDTWGNFSAWVEVSGSAVTPPLPTLASPVFDKGGGKRSRWGMKVPVSVNDLGHNDNVEKIKVQICHKAANVAPTSSDRRRKTDVVRIGKEDPDEASFRNLPRKQYVFMRGMSIDDDQKDSGYGGWIACGRPMDAVAPEGPVASAVTGLTKDNTTTPRVIKWGWDDPDDDVTTQWMTTVKVAGVAVWGPKPLRHPAKDYTVRDANRGTAHTIEIVPMDDDGLSAGGLPASDSGTATATHNADVLTPGTLNAAPFASSIRPVGLGTVLPTLPDSNYPAGSMFYNTNSDRLYETKSGTSWTEMQTFGNTTGQVAAGQIAAGAVTAGAISVTQLSAISANMGTITSGSIQSGTVRGSLVTTNAGFDANYISLDGIFGKDQIQFVSSGGTTVLTATGGGVRFGGGINAGLGWWGHNVVTRGTVGNLTNTSGTNNDGTARAKINELLGVLRNYGLIG